MADLSLFPPQRDGSKSAASSSWTSLSHTTELGLPSQDWADSDLEACLDLAFAALIWAYTGDDSVCFLTTRLANVHHQHAAEILEVQLTATFAEAVRSIRSDRVPLDNTIDAPSILVHVPQDGGSFNNRSFEPIAKGSVPLELFTEREGGIAGNSIRVTAWSDSNYIHAFHVDSYVRHFLKYASHVWQSKHDARLEDLDLLIASDRDFIARWNSKLRPLDSRTIHDCTSQMALRGPDKLAIDAWDGQLSRGELEQQAGILAHLLGQAKVQRGCVVGVLMDKSKSVPVTILGILKAGAAFLLLDVSLPRERLKIQTGKTNVAHIVTTRDHTALACQLVSTVVVDEGRGKFSIVDTGHQRQAFHNIERTPIVSPDDPAFYIFTSGSSGIPKAMLINHEAWVTTCGEPHLLDITESSRVFQYSSFSYIVSTIDILHTLIAGGTVCIPSPEERTNDLTGAIHRLKPDFVRLTPSVLKILDPDQVSSLQTVVSAGEPIQRPLAETWLASGRIKLRNGYGQSEACSTNSTAALSSSTANYRSIGDNSPLGYWIVDPQNHDRLMPVGATGELLLEGHSIAQGYVEEPAKTAAAFISAPKWAAQFGAGVDGRKWYKTGDLVQYQGNGEVFLFGRKDRQLKVNGQRVEAAEIEHHIMTAVGDKVQQAIIDQVERDQQRRLVAFVLLRSSRDSGISFETRNEDSEEISLHQAIADRLQNVVPLWMIPTKVVVVRSIPKTATGKLDRRSLKERYEAQELQQLQASQNGPGAREEKADENDYDWRTDAERSTFAALRSLCSSVLKVPKDRISPSSRWTALGGDSLSALMFVRDARLAGLRLTTTEVMSGETLLELCRTIPEPETTLSTGSQEAPAQWQGNSQFEVTDFQAEYLPRGSGAERGLLYKFDMTLPATVDTERLLQSLYRWVESTEALRFSFVQQPKSRPLQFVIPPEDTRWRSRVYSLSEVDDIDEVSSRHDFFRHPLLAAVRPAMVRQQDSIQLILHINHSIFDGISFGHLLNDLLNVYLDRPIDSRPGFTGYLHDRLLKQSPETLSYWKDLLRGSSPTGLRRLRDTPTGTSDRHAYSSAEHCISRSVYLQRPVDRPNNTSMSTLVQSAWGLVLSVLAQRTDIMSMCLVHGRDEEIAGSDKIIGPCVSEFPLRTQLRDSMASTELLDLVQRQMWESAPHAHLGSSTIAAKCTNWPSRENRYQHSSFVQHQGVVTPHSLAIGDQGHLHIGEPEVEHALTYDFDLLTKSAHPDELYLSLRCLQDCYSVHEAEAVVDAFVAAVRMLVSGPTTVDEVLTRVRATPSLPVVNLA
jgi:amino acid adenylation domain-containing protein